MDQAHPIEARHVRGRSRLHNPLTIVYVAVTVVAAASLPSALAQSSPRNPAPGQGAKPAQTPGTAVNPAPGPTNAAKYSETPEFALWNKYEDVAIHFNTL